MNVPRFSIVGCFRDLPVELLGATVNAAVSQTFESWELCFVDDASSDRAAGNLLRELAADEPRVRGAVRSHRVGDARAWNDAIAMASGEFVGLVEPGDLLTPDALAVMNHVLTVDVADYAYSDARELLGDGSVGRPILHPDWSPELLRAQNYLRGLVVIRRSLLGAVGGFRSGFEGSGDHDLALRSTERATRVLHVPEPVYLRRTISASGAAVAEPIAVAVGRRAVQEQCDRLGIRGVVEAVGPGRLYRVHRELTMAPLVSVVVATGFATDGADPESPFLVSACVRSVVDVSSHRGFEVVVVAGPGTPEAVATALEALLLPPHRMVRAGAIGDAVARNLGASVAEGELLAFVDDDVEILTPDWIETLAGLAVEPDCGLVGATMLTSGGSAERDAAGELKVERECFSVSTAAAMLRREVWDQVGGLCEELPRALQAVDLGLKIRRDGRRVVWTPHIALRRLGSKKGSARIQFDLEPLRRRWGRLVDRDSFPSTLLPPVF